MRCRSVVLCRVLVFRVVAAADVAAFEAQPKVDPRISGGKTFLTASWRVGLVIARSTEMSAKSLGHRTSVRLSGGVGLRRRVHELAASNPRATLRFYEVVHMLNPPMVLFAPPILIAVLFTRGGLP